MAATPIEEHFESLSSPHTTAHLTDSRAAPVLTTARQRQQVDALTGLSQTFVANAQDARRVKIGTTRTITVGLRDSGAVISQSAIEGRLGIDDMLLSSSVVSAGGKRREVALVATAVATGENAVDRALVGRQEIEKVGNIIIKGSQ